LSSSDLAPTTSAAKTRDTYDVQVPEVLVSQTVKDLVAGSGIAFAGRGAAQLKGIPGEWRLYAVSAT
jgi:hypothetical protein